MAKKNYLITGLIVAAAVAGGIYYLNKRKQKGGDSDLATEPGAAEPGAAEPGETETAVVTAKSKGDIYDAIEKATEIASNTKDAVVTVKDAAENIIAEVTSGEASDPSKKEARRARRAERRSRRKAKRAARRTRRRGRRRRK